MASPDDFFNGNLNAFRSGKLAKYVVFDLGLSPSVGRKEFPRALIFMPQSTLSKAVQKHNIDLNILSDLPTMLLGSDRIYRSKTVENSFVLRLSERWGGEYLVAALEYVKHADFGNSYMLKSIHTRPDEQFSRWDAEGLLLYKK